MSRHETPPAITSTPTPSPLYTPGTNRVFGWRVAAIVIRVLSLMAAAFIVMNKDGDVLQLLWYLDFVLALIGLLLLLTVQNLQQSNSIPRLVLSILWPFISILVFQYVVGAPWRSAIVYCTISALLGSILLFVRLIVFDKRRNTTYLLGIIIGIQAIAFIRLVNYVFDWSELTNWSSATGHVIAQWAMIALVGVSSWIDIQQAGRSLTNGTTPSQTAIQK